MLVSPWAPPQVADRGMLTRYGGYQDGPKLAMLPSSLILNYQGLEEENLDQKSPGPPGWGLMQWASSSLIVKRQEMLKKPNTKPWKSKHQWRNRGMAFGFRKMATAV